MPFVNRCGGQAVDLQNKTITASTDSQIITPDSGYDGLNQITVPAYSVRCAEAIIDSPVEVGEGSDARSSTNLMLINVTLTSCDSGDLPEASPDLITINVITASGNVKFISSDSNSTAYDETGIISINAVLKTDTGDPAYKSYLSYVTAYSDRSNINDLNSVVNDDKLRVYNGFTTSYRYWYVRSSTSASEGTFIMEIPSDSDSYITYMQELPKFYTKSPTNTSGASIPCTINQSHFMCSNSANSNIKVKYLIRCFWGVSSDAYPADNTVT